MLTSIASREHDYWSTSKFTLELGKYKRANVVSSHICNQLPMLTYQAAGCFTKICKIFCCMGPTWAPWRPHEFCYLGSFENLHTDQFFSLWSGSKSITDRQIVSSILIVCILYEHILRNSYHTYWVNLPRCLECDINIHIYIYIIKKDSGFPKRQVHHPHVQDLYSGIYPRTSRAHSLKQTVSVHWSYT